MPACLVSYSGKSPALPCCRHTHKLVSCYSNVLLQQRVYSFASKCRHTHTLASCHSSVLLQLDGLHLRVDRAGQSAHGSAGGNVVYERNRTVFVGNLPFDVEVRVIRIAFWLRGCKHESVLHMRRALSLLS